MLYTYQPKVLNCIFGFKKKKCDVVVNDIDVGKLMVVGLNPPRSDP